MATDHIRYDILAQDALRGVVRNVLTDVAEQGLPGEHHFFITFEPDAEGVRMSPRLLAQYPEEMTDRPAAPVLGPEGDRRALRGRPVVRRHPGAARSCRSAPIKSFVDPSVQFGLQFETSEAPSVASPETVAGRAPRRSPSAAARACQPSRRRAAE